MTSSKSPQDNALQNFHVTIVGAGIAGLTAALYFAKSHAEIDIFERADSLEEVGAGIQIAPNASHILGELGLFDALRPHWVEPDHICLKDAYSLKTFSKVPVGQLAHERWDAPYTVLRRSALQKVLLDAVSQSDQIRLHLSSELDFSSPNHLVDDLTTKSGHKPDLIIGADGVNSKVRTLLPLTGDVNPTSYLAWRILAPHALVTEHAPEMGTSNDVHVLMAKDAHTAIYPRDEKDTHNVIFVTKCPGEDEQPDFARTLADIDLDDGVKEILRNSENLGFWPIREVENEAWGNAHNIVLVGDAAHAMSPFLAQGAAMAIEDAAVMAQCVIDNGHNVPLALQLYEKRRSARVAKVKQRTAFNRFSYHASGPTRWVRNIILSVKSPNRLGRDLDWLYGWRVENDPS